MPRYMVTVEFYPREVLVTAKNAREACSIVRRKVRDGKIRAKLRPNNCCCYGKNIYAERWDF